MRRSATAPAATACLMPRIMTDLLRLDLLAPNTSERAFSLGDRHYPGITAAWVGMPIFLSANARSRANAPHSQRLPLIPSATRCAGTRPLGAGRREHARVRVASPSPVSDGPGTLWVAVGGEGWRTGLIPEG